MELSTSKLNRRLANLRATDITLAPPQHLPNQDVPPITRYGLTRLALAVVRVGAAQIPPSSLCPFNSLSYHNHGKQKC